MFTVRSQKKRDHLKDQSVDVRRRSERIRRLAGEV
jgi:hypothetical protein